METSKIIKIKVSTGIFWVEIPEADVRILCSCPADSVKHLMKRGLINSREENKILYETGPNVILLSDVLVQNGEFSNLSEFPVLQMLYRQGMILPNHPGNTGIKPMIVGSKEQVNAQMDYIYRGNYGLTTEKEMIDAGVDKETAKKLYNLKIRFAFGKIKESEEFLDTRIIEEKEVEINNKVFIKRIKVNIFEIKYKNEKIRVDLNLDRKENYQTPYPLGYNNFNREYFGIIHSGNGDGWNVNEPTMSSVIMFQGKIYLIDAGPNLEYVLNKLGIGINEIEGIFHTHSHDDHFCGLTVLMRSCKKIKYYATPLVRNCVIKKAAALLNKKEDFFKDYFEICDLKFNKWNNINGLNVKPIFSPHPVETTIFLFKALQNNSYKTYAHFADIIDLEILNKMVVNKNKEFGVCVETYNRVKKNYLQKVDLKKIDVGGGLIHGNAQDFKKDKSEKIILSHISGQLTQKQKMIGSGAPFGMIDVLINTSHDYIWTNAFKYLKSYFPSVPQYEIEMLLNNEIKTFNPETIILKQNEKSEYLYLILTGNIEVFNTKNDTKSILSAGAIIGDEIIFSKLNISNIYRAISFVKVLSIPLGLYIAFIKQNKLYKKILMFEEKRCFLNTTNLFSDGISYDVLNEILQSIKIKKYKSGFLNSADFEDGLYLIKKGKVNIIINEMKIETLDSGDFFGESNVLFATSDLYLIEATTDLEIFFINRDMLKDIPIVHWKLYETYQKRITFILNPKVNKSMFEWKNEYTTNVEKFDEEHKKMFQITKRLYDLKQTNKFIDIEKVLNELIIYTKKHFKNEEKLFKKYKYPLKEEHMQKHKILIDKIMFFKKTFFQKKQQIDGEILLFLKDWIVDHILIEDRQYGSFFNKNSVY